MLTLNEAPPQVGEGASIYSGVDAWPATVISVNRSQKSCLIQEDYQSGEPNPQGPIYQVRRRQTGKWRITRCEDQPNQPGEKDLWQENGKGQRVVFGRRVYRRNPDI